MTNPAIDPFREAIVTSLRCFVGPEGDITASLPGHARRLELEQPILTIEVTRGAQDGRRRDCAPATALARTACLRHGASPSSPQRPPCTPQNLQPQQECEAVKSLAVNDWATQVIYTTWPVSEGPAGLRAALETICAQAEAAVDAGAAFLVLSDRTFGPERAPVPSLLAVGAVHHRLVDAKKRSRVGLVVETGEVRPGFRMG